jgi:hypothetical protein
VIRLARDPRKFTFLHACAPDTPIILGDARLTLSVEPERAYDLIIIDAFTSDAIPTHLMTREAMGLYKSKLDPDGAIMMHISNQHLELASVVAGIGAADDFHTWLNEFDDDSREDEYAFPSTVTISAALEGNIGGLIRDENWEQIKPGPRDRLWTDDYSNLLGAVLRNLEWWQQEAEE